MGRGGKTCHFNGKSFPSETEMLCYKALLAWEEEGGIGNIAFQPVLKFILPDGREIKTYKGRQVMSYKPDFVVTMLAQNMTLYVEAKGWPSDVFKLRYAVARALYPQCKFIMWSKRKGFVDAV